MIILIALATFLATLIGGLVALRLKDRLHLIIGFSAGAVLGVAFFDLIPESLKLGSQFYNINIVTSLIAAGFFIYLILDRMVFLHAHSHDAETGHEEALLEAAHINRGVLGAGSLSIHSFLDGLAIGLAFQVSSTIGLVIALAVLVHDFSDGINTVNMILKNRGKVKNAFKWLLVDAIAPVIGVISTMFFVLPEQALGVILSLFAGFFLYIGASDLIPESQHAHPKLMTTFMTVLGAAVLFAVIRLTGL